MDIINNTSDLIAQLKMDFNNDNIMDLIQKAYPELTCLCAVVVGSTMNGLALNESDIDIIVYADKAPRFCSKLVYSFEWHGKTVHGWVFPLLEELKDFSLSYSVGNLDYLLLKKEDCIWVNPKLPNIFDCILSEKEKIAEITLNIKLEFEREIILYMYYSKNYVTNKLWYHYILYYFLINNKSIDKTLLLKVKNEKALTTKESNMVIDILYKLLNMHDKDDLYLQRYFEMNLKFKDKLQKIAQVN